jgi:hypothetical protein
VASIDADYLEKVGNVSTGRTQYKTWYEEALKLDEERQAKYKKMVSASCRAFRRAMAKCLLTRSRMSRQISDMKAAGSSEKDIKTATLAFKRQEALFQEKLKSVSSTFDEDHERKELLQMKAKQELAKVNLNIFASQGGTSRRPTNVLPCATAVQGPSGEGACASSDC